MGPTANRKFTLFEGTIFNPKQKDDDDKKSFYPSAINQIGAIREIDNDKEQIYLN
jgi:hypothetical protein